MKILVLAGLLATTAALAGCERLLDIDRAEAAVKSGLTEQLGMPFASVSCPESRPIKAGDVFECKAVAETGGDLTIRVTQEDDAGALDWKVVNAGRVLSMAKLEEQIKAGLARQANLDASVDCGLPKMRVANAGQTFNCTATAGKESRPVAVAITDDNGNVTWAVK
jgi:hypothetical protein